MRIYARKQEVGCTLLLEIKKQTFTCSKSTIEATKKSMKCVKVNNNDNRTTERRQGSHSVSCLHALMHMRVNELDETVNYEPNLNIHIVRH